MQQMSNTRNNGGNENGDENNNGENGNGGLEEKNL